MFLKTLTLKGFKSFADTTALDLEPGITVVVGPNGSGKSNVVDAVAWVLGAQGPRALRSTRMEDVIFAGTARRAALGRAEVSLTIDNSSGVMPIGFTEVTITRTLWRSGESEYALNGAPCRLLDIQELLSDAGVGRQQHVIVGQGQLDVVLSAQPTDRRLIIEEAAGILKFRRRRERAQRRLEATEGNLVRAQDLLREIRRQLRPLERQAEAARRHGAVLAELVALRRFVAGQELAALTARASTADAARRDLSDAERSLVSTLAGLDAGVCAAEAAMLAADTAADWGPAASRGTGLADGVARAVALRERAGGLAAVLAERARFIERLRQVSVDADLVASLEAEASDLVAGLKAVQDAAERLVPEAERLGAVDDELTARRAAFEATRHPDVAQNAGGGPGGDPARRSGGVAPGGAGSDEAGVGGSPGEGEAARVRTELDALLGAAGRAEIERERLQGRLTALVGKAERLAAESATLNQDLVESEAGAGLDAAEQATSDRLAAEAMLETAEHAFAAASGQHRSWVARAETLAAALDEARARAGAERLASVEGLIGTLLDVVEVDAGWEQAFEAAIGEALAAVVVDGHDAARRALAHLHAEGIGGAVLALGASPAQPSGLPATAAPATASPATAPGATVAPASVSATASSGTGLAPVPGPAFEVVRDHVRASRPAVAVLLDRLLAGAVAVHGDWAEALDLACRAPGMVVVTRSGDRFADAGWRAGTGGAGATGAALEEAKAQARRAEAELAEATQTLVDTRHAAATARAAAAEVARAADRRAARDLHAATALARAERDGREVADEMGAIRAQLAELKSRGQRDDARAAELAAALPALVAEEEARRDRAIVARAARAALDEARADLERQEAAARALRTDLEIRAAGLDERRAMLTQRRAEVEARLGRHLAERSAAQRRRIELAGHVVAVARLGTVVAARAAEVDILLARLQEERRAHAARTAALGAQLDDLRRRRAIAERDLVAVRERIRHVELEEAEVRLRVEAAIEALRRDVGCDPSEAAASRCPPLVPGVTATQRVSELERDLRLMGPINPLALEEHAALVERHDFVEVQMADVKAGRRELAKVIAAIDAEIVEVFSAAFVDVAANFTTLFALLFPGGTGGLRLTEPDNLLETGIEVEARPSGKNVKRLSLLSGGERSLTAMAFLFAVFRSRPSPFYLMDEVEAALDDVNLHRFIDLIREFRREAQLLIVSHQRRTMEAADCLFGVTMQPGGSSKVVSERVSTTAEP